MSLSPRESRWLEAIQVRRARRSYTTTPLSAEEISALVGLCREHRPFGDLARVLVVAEAPSRLFMGIVGAYGGVSGSPSALVFAGRESASHVQEAVGYTGEGLVLEATALGLDTCWVAGIFSAHHAALLGGLAEGERAYAVSALGHANKGPTVKERVLFGAGRPKFRREREEIAPGIEGWPAWACAGVEAARIAPSAMNRQPWRFRLEGDDIVVSAEGAETPRTSKRLDCGIAMLHFELAARAVGASGRWELLEHPDVARWVTTG